MMEYYYWTFGNEFQFSLNQNATIYMQVKYIFENVVYLISAILFLSPSEPI